MINIFSKPKQKLYYEGQVVTYYHDRRREWVTGVIEEIDWHGRWFIDGKPRAAIRTIDPNATGWNNWSDWRTADELFQAGA